MEVLDVEAALRQRGWLRHAGEGVHALQSTWLASEFTAQEPPCKEAHGQTEKTQTHAQDMGLTLQQPHEEPGGGHESEMCRSDVGEQRGEHREEPPGRCRQQEDFLTSYSGTQKPPYQNQGESERAKSPSQDPRAFPSSACF